MKFALTLLFIFVSAAAAFSQPSSSGDSPSADAVIQKAVQQLGGERYRNVASQIGYGKFSIMKGGVNVSFQSFIDVIVFPDKERTEFKALGVKTVQTNTGNTGWVFDAYLVYLK